MVSYVVLYIYVFFFKQKTAYEMRISDWSSDACSSDLIGLERVIRRFPFVPNDPAQLDEDCYEAFNIQVEGLARRFQATSGNHMIIGVSGGLDSTHALIVAAKACDRLGRSEERRVGKGCVSACSSRWSPYPKTKKNNKNHYIDK